MNCSSSGIPVHHHLVESTQTHVHWVGDAIQPSHPLSSSSPPALNLSQHQGLFKWVSCSHEVAKVLEFHPQHPSFQSTFRTECILIQQMQSISFRMDWLDLLAVQGMLKSLLQHHGSKAWILWVSAFFIVQLSHPCMTTGKTIALTRWTFDDILISLLFNTLSMLVRTFLPTCKRLLISWLQSPSAVIFGAHKNSDNDSLHCFLIYLPWSDETWGHDVSFLNVEMKPTFSPSSFTFIKRFFSSSSLSAIRVVSSAHLKLLIFLLAILNPACSSSSPAFSWCTLNIS